VKADEAGGAGDQNRHLKASGSRGERANLAKATSPGIRFFHPESGPKWPCKPLKLNANKNENRLLTVLQAKISA